MKLSSITVLYIIENSLSSVSTALQGLGEPTDLVLKKVQKTLGCVRSMRINDKELTFARYHRIVTYIKYLEDLLKPVHTEGTFAICMVNQARTLLLDLRFTLNSIALENNLELVY